MRVALTRGFVFWSGLAVLTLFFLPGNGEAQGVTYLGLEPEQLVALLDLSAVDRSDGRLTELDAQLATHPEARLWNEKGLILAAREEWKQAEEAFRHASHELAAARLGLAVSLVQQGEHKDALEVVEEPGGVDDDHRNRLRFARVLLRLHADVKVRFSELRQELAPFLFSASSGSSVFDLWLGLNPEREELESVLEALRPLGTPFAAWQRAEVLLRLGKVQRALREIRDLEQGPSTDDELRNRILRAQARALFQLGSDGAGQSAYRRILHRLDEPTADLLYRDIAVLASPSERGQFPALSLEEKADFFWQFWMRRHPVPVEEVNPRLAEHYRRLDQALAEYPLQSTGHGYFTDEDTFLSYSPALPYYSSRATFNRGPASRYWIDHRGLILLLHGEPDLRIGPRSHGGSNKTESWAISRFQTRPLIFNFVKRPAVGEWTLVLSLAVAATRPSAPDDPTAVYEALARGVTRSYGRLYQSRIRLHPIYRQVLEVRSRRDLLRAFRAESELMASFVTAGLGSDSTDYY
ncbi:MAG: GWxTD domain-containing protein, partial [Acidobacteriota bacterium]